MAKQTKPKSKRTQVKDLPVAQQELTTDEASKLKGGTNTQSQYFGYLRRDSLNLSRPASTDLSLVKKT